MSRKFLSVVIIFLGGVAFIIAAWMMTSIDFLSTEFLLDEKIISQEFLKIIFQFLTICVLGALLSILYPELKYHREQREKLDNERKIIAQKLIKSYSTIKKERRTLRAGKKSFETYKNVLEEISTTQLDIESIIDDLETTHKTFSNNVEILGNIKTMKKYLDNLITEYEKECPTLKEMKFEIDGQRLQLTQEYIAKYVPETEYGGFVGSYRKAHELMRKEILPK
jgi:hypothetical protein